MMESADSKVAIYHFDLLHIIFFFYMKKLTFHYHQIDTTDSDFHNLFICRLVSIGVVKCLEDG